MNASTIGSIRSSEMRTASFEEKYRKNVLVDTSAASAICATVVVP